MHKDLIIATCKAEGLLRNQAAYVLATADWETNHTFEPVREAYFLGSKAEPYRKKLRYYPWYGRGFVQLTWEENYARAGRKLGVDLIADPDRALDPEIAARVLVVGMREGWFTGKKLSSYITLQRSDWDNARRIVNGMDRAGEIAELARKYDRELLAAGYGVDRPELPTPPAPAPQRHWFAVLVLSVIQFIASLFRKGPSK